MAHSLSYRPRPGDIPTAPGVYRFRDDAGRVLYVGKAKNLRARLSNYFAPLPSLHERTRRMVTTASGVEWTVVGSDIEALQLEFTWIKEFDPPFNVKFRDDKTYPFMAITLADEAPRVMVTRNTRIKGARYFGPYPKIWAVHNTVDLMIKAFPIRTCSDASYKKAMETGRPCFPGQIGRCGGPCSGRVTIDEHAEVVKDFVSFMAGNDRRFVTEATRSMKEAAAAQDYERAAIFRDRLLALEAVLEKSTVVLREGVDADLFGIEHDDLAAAIQQFIVRGGRIRGVRGWTVDKEIDMSTAELVDSVIQRAYAPDNLAIGIPREVIVPELPDDSAELESLLTTRRGTGRVRLHTAQRGEKAALMQTAVVNAKNALMLYKTKRSSDFVARSQALQDIQESIGMSEAPLRIECFDVSHLSGTNIVASMVVFEDGLPRKDQYRRFSISASTDDTDSIYQVLSRRLAYLTDTPAEDDLSGADAKPKRFAYPPQLIIVDGGQPQVGAAQRAFDEAGIGFSLAPAVAPSTSRVDVSSADAPHHIQLAGMAKRLEEIWLPDSDFPVILPRGSEALFLLQRVRDEAHRFAISFQRSKRKNDITSILTTIPGLGPARVTALLKHFGSVSRLRGAAPEEISAVPGIGPQLADSINERLKNRKDRSLVRASPNSIIDSHCSPSRGSPVTDQTPQQEVLIVTGMSGAGRTTVANALEDLDWYVVDNLPPQMLRPLVDLAGRVEEALPRIAAVVDIRGRDFFADLQEMIASLRQGIELRVVFLDATDAALVRRFESVRRPHPLQGRGTLLDGISKERTRLAAIRESSDIVIDTSDLNIHQLATTVGELFRTAETPGLQVTVQSFGFKYGIPTDADIVADARFLPNPFWIPELRSFTGEDAEVSNFVLAQEGAQEFVDGYVGALTPVFAGYQRENKRHATVAIGCTGGKHRSVALAEVFAERLGKLPGVAASIKHRDLGRE